MFFYKEKKRLLKFEFLFFNTASEVSCSRATTSLNLLTRMRYQSLERKFLLGLLRKYGGSVSAYIWFAFYLAWLIFYFYMSLCHKDTNFILCINICMAFNEVWSGIQCNLFNTQWKGSNYFCLLRRLCVKQSAYIGGTTVRTNLALWVIEFCVLCVYVLNGLHCTLIKKIKIKLVWCNGFICVW